MRHKEARKEAEIVSEAIPIISSFESKVEISYKVENGIIDLASDTTVWEAKAYCPASLTEITRVAAQAANYNLFAGRRRIGLILPSVQWEKFDLILFLRAYLNCVVLETDVRRITASIPQWPSWHAPADDPDVHKQLKEWTGVGSLPGLGALSSKLTRKQLQVRDKYTEPLRFLLENRFDVACTAEFVRMCLAIDTEEVEKLVKKNRTSVDRPPHKVAGFIARALWDIQIEWVEDRQRNRIKGKRTLRPLPNFLPSSQWIADNLSSTEHLFCHLTGQKATHFRGE